LRPIQEGNTAPKKVLSLKEQAQRITKDNKKGSAQGGLNNELSWENTDLNSYDSYALRGLLVDESAKFSKETPIDKYLPIVAKTLKKGAKVVGKIFMPTTCNPPTEGGAEYRSEERRVGKEAWLLLVSWSMHLTLHDYNNTSQVLSFFIFKQKTAYEVFT